MGYKLWDMVCGSCGAECELLVADDEPERCEVCGAVMSRVPFTAGTATRAQHEPARIREMFSKAQHIRLRTQGRLPWRRSSYSQSGND